MIWRTILHRTLYIVPMLMSLHHVDSMSFTQIAGGTNIRVNESFSLRCSVDVYAAYIIIDDPHLNRVSCRPPGILPASCSGAVGFTANGTEKTVTLEKYASLYDDGLWTCIYNAPTPTSISYQVYVIQLDNILGLQQNIVLQSTALNGSNIDTKSNDTFTVIYGCISKNVTITWELSSSSWTTETTITNSSQYSCNSTNTQLYTNTLSATDILSNLNSGTSTLVVRVFHSGEELAHGNFDVTFNAGQKYCQVSDIQTRNLAKGKKDMTTDDTRCKVVCPATVIVTEIVNLIVTVIIVYLLYDTICSMFRYFVYVCVAIHISTVIIAVVISGGIVGKLREDGSIGYCCEVDVVVLSAVIPVLIMTICIGIVALLLIIKFSNIRQGHKKKTLIRTWCSKLTSKVTTASSRSDKQPPGATETLSIVSPAGILVTAAGTSGKKKLPPIEKPQAAAKNSEYQNNQPTERPKPSTVQTSDAIKESKLKSKKNKTSKNINEQQQQTTSENKFHGNIQKTTNRQTNENRVPLNQNNNNRTVDGNVRQDELEKRKNEQQTNEKLEQSSQETESDMPSNKNNNSQKNLKPKEMTDNVGQTSHRQQQQTNNEHEKHKLITSQIQYDTITYNTFENHEDSKHSSAEGGKNDQIKHGKKAKHILQNDDSIKEAEINSTIDEMANTQGTIALEQHYPDDKKMLHEKQDKAITNQPNVEHMPEKTDDVLPSDLSNRKHSPTGGENGKGEVINSKNGQFTS